MHVPTGSQLASAAAACALAAAAATMACGTTDAVVAITPITAVVVRTDSLIGELGCGRGDGQVFKYAAVIAYQDADGGDGTERAGAVYDCFADALFVDSVDESAAYTVDVFAYNAATFEGNEADIQAAIADSGHAGQRLAGLPSTWTTHCTATQQSQIQVLAVCPALQRSSTAPPLTGRVTLPTASFAFGDSGTLECGIHYNDVAVALTNESGDDAGTYQAHCPDPIQIVAPPARYTLQVDLNGGLVHAVAACWVEALANVTSTPVCDPAQ